MTRKDHKRPHSQQASRLSKTRYLRKGFMLLDQIVSLFVFMVAAILVIFAAVRFSIVMKDFLPWAVNFKPVHEMSGNEDLSSFPAFMMLHQIALVIVFVKAYRILVAYALHHHVDVRFIVEISIIAPAVEVIFNSRLHQHPWIMAMLGSYGLANLLLYLLFYQRRGHRSQR